MPVEHSTNHLLQQTRILDHGDPAIQRLIDQRGWRSMPRSQAIRAIYQFCRDDIAFGYNSGADDMPASLVLKEGIGHCNTKTSLLMALYRAIGISCRLRGSTINKELQRGALTPLVYRLAPREIIHTWVEALFDGRWLGLEGVILDSRYLASVQDNFPMCTHRFRGYGVACANLQRPDIDWTGRDTFIQHQGIAREFGRFDTPDDFYAQHPTNLRGLRGWLYRHYFFRVLNRNLAAIREGAALDGSKIDCGCGAQAR